MSASHVERAALRLSSDLMALRSMFDFKSRRPLRTAEPATKKAFPSIPPKNR